MRCALKALYRRSRLRLNMAPLRVDTFTPKLGLDLSAWTPGGRRFLHKSGHNLRNSVGTLFALSCFECDCPGLIMEHNGDE